MMKCIRNTALRVLHTYIALQAESNIVMQIQKIITCKCVKQLQSINSNILENTIEMLFSSIMWENDN